MTYGSKCSASQSVEEFEEVLEEQLTHLHEALKTDTYRPQPVKQKLIPKPARSWLLLLRDLMFSSFITLIRILFSLGSRLRYDVDRDRLEEILIQRALHEQLPVLGICRGAQLMNVVLGGNLHQSMNHFYSETPHIRSVLPAKHIRVDQKSQLYTLLNTTSCYVNALHDQSANSLGEHIKISAEEENGVVQAIELQEHPFFIGVQWHPEYMPQSKRQLALFQGLVEEARQLRAKNSG